MPNCPHCGSKYVERKSSDTQYKDFVLYYCLGCKELFKIEKPVAQGEYLMTLSKARASLAEDREYFEIFRTSTGELAINQKIDYNTHSSGIATLMLSAHENNYRQGEFYLTASTFQGNALRAHLWIDRIEMNKALTERAKNVEVMKAIWDSQGYFDLSDKHSEIVIREVCDFLISTIGTGASKNSNGCYVATAVYGSYNCPEVWTLRRFRDFTLAESWYGRAFIRVYYAISPTLVKWFGNTAWFKNICKPALDHMVKQLNASGVENTPYTDKIW